MRGYPLKNNFYHYTSKNRFCIQKRKFLSKQKNCEILINFDNFKKPFF